MIVFDIGQWWQYQYCIRDIRSVLIPPGGMVQIKKINRTGYKKKNVIMKIEY